MAWSTVISNQLLTSTGLLGPIAYHRLDPQLRYPRLQLEMTVPDTGTVSIVTEGSNDNGATWFLLTADSVTGRPPSTKAGASSHVTITTALVSSGVRDNTLVQGRVVTLTGTWRATVRTEF